MTSLFSSFDLNFFLTSFMSFIFFYSIIFNFIFNLSLIKIFMSSFFMSMENFFYSLKPKMFNKFFSLMLFLFMFSIFFMNFGGVWFYNFAFTSQMSMVLFLSLIFWSCMIMFYLKVNLKGFLSHSVPEGTPIYLTWFLFLIELISNSIRPITLSVRLVANILSGHLLMILLYKLVNLNSLFFIFYVGLNSVEIFVSIIQAYIFFTMISLYYSELI